MKLTIGYLYPDLLNLYGDCGNIQCLKKRLEWRGMEASIVPLSSESRIDFTRLDIVMLGGGSDREQELAARGLRSLRKELGCYLEDNGVLLAICGGYQLLGDYYKTGRKTIKCLELLHFYTECGSKRLVQNVVVQSPFFSSPVVGFVNHGGRTHIGDYTPLGEVLYGFGNTETSHREGLLYKNTLGTYLHGPLLPKNPEICDFLIARALHRKYGKKVCLDPLPDGAEKRANSYLVKNLVFYP
ncbi:MAG: glutamine amidotransferase [Lachnospiraceae bacterium]|nr:glutamine amidotransferase [Lachnospiraceae bacterium]